MPEGRYTSIVEKFQPAAARPGDIVDSAGNVLGCHDGIIHFTVGQRKGLGLSGNDEPLFVLKLTLPRRVVVGRALSASTSIHLQRQLATLSAQGVAIECAVKVRSMRPPAAARVTKLVDGGAM